MRDLNFFEPFLDKKRRKFNKMIFLYLLLAAVVIGLGVLGTLNQLEINALEKEVSSLSAVANDPQTLQKVEEVKAFEEETEKFKAEVDNIRLLDASIRARDVIGEELLYDINSRLPQGVFLTNMNVVGREISLTGYAEDQYSIAEFGKGLVNLPEAKEIFISNIQGIESYYRFNLNLTLKEVLVDAN